MNAARASLLRRHMIEHIVRAVSGVSGQMRLVLVGTGAVIAQRKITPLALMMTRELDVYAPDADDIDGVSTLIDASVGEGSQFDVAFGYYAHGIGPGTAILPHDWMTRAVAVTWPSAPGVTCVCPEINDIALAKLCAWREKDVDWLRAAQQAGLLGLAEMRQRAARLDAPAAPAAEEVERRLALLATAPGWMA